MEIRPFRHLDVDDLKQQTAGYAAAPAIIATDGVYGISGEVAPLAEVAGVAETINAALLVDDAHGFGVLGATGRGTAELCGVEPARVTILASMSKAMGTYGGLLAGKEDLINEFRHSPEASGSTVLPTAITAASLAALDLIRHQPVLRRRMNANAEQMRRILTENGISVACDRHPIIAMLLKGEAEAAGLSKHLLSRGLRIPCFRYASEPRHNLLRGIARAVYTDEHLDAFARAIRSRPQERPFR